MRIQAVRAPFYSPPSSLPGPSPSHDGGFSEGLSGGRVRCGSTYKGCPGGGYGAGAPIRMTITSHLFKKSFPALSQAMPGQAFIGGRVDEEHDVIAVLQVAAQHGGPGELDLE